MWIFFTCLIVGILLGFSGKLPEKFLKYNGILQRIGIILLLFSMGASIGSNRQMIHNIRYIGVKSLAFALIASLFSIICTYLLSKKLIQDGGGK